GDSTWRQGLDTWYDPANRECRGSLVLLEPGTSYEIQLGMPGQTASSGLITTTWSEQFPIAQTITVGSQSTTLNVTQSGTPNGYVLYQAAPGAVIDVGASQPVAISIAANYVIVRGFTVKGGQHGIMMQPGQHDIVIEQNDVSGWGTYRTTNAAGWQLGTDEDGGITARCYNNVGDVYRYV